MPGLAKGCSESATPFLALIGDAEALARWVLGTLVPCQRAANDRDHLRGDEARTRACLVPDS